MPSFSIHSDCFCKLVIRSYVPAILRTFILNVLRSIKTFILQPFIYIYISVCVFYINKYILSPMSDHT